MKRVRLLILTGLILAALIAAVVPALAGGPAEAFNWSFEGDKNGDNIPDKWNVKGDVLRLCDHKYAAPSNCMMVVKPSSSGAALWQILDFENETWVVLGEEATCTLGGGYIGALTLDSDRVYYGHIYKLKDGTEYTFYGALPGGTYPIQPTVVNVTLPTCAEPGGIDEGDVASLRFGILALPGDGYLGADYLFVD